MANNCYKDIAPVCKYFILKQKLSKPFYNIINYINNILILEKLNGIHKFLDLHCILYCAAWTTAKDNVWDLVFCFVCQNKKD